MSKKNKKSKKVIKVIKESDTGRNLIFDVDGRKFPVQQLCNEIDEGKHKGYHIRIINGKRTPVSNPDNNKGNNLG